MATETTRLLENGHFDELGLFIHDRLTIITFTSNAHIFDYPYHIVECFNY